MFYPYICKNEKCKQFNKEITITKPMKDCTREEYCECCGELLVRPIFSYHGSYKSTEGFYAKTQS